jgi:RNA polymerase sigma-54 factor
MLNQKLQQRLLQKLSPQQIQLMKLIEIPAMSLEQRIKQEMEENPALEEGAENEETDDLQLEQNEQEASKDDVFNNENVDMSDYFDDDETPAYKLTVNNTSRDDLKKDIPFASGISFQETLISQLGLRVSDKHQYQIGLYIIGNIDDSGYLQRETNAMVDDLAFTLNISTTVREIEEVLKIIQDFEPLGIGARTLQECLLIQLKKLDNNTESVKNAIRIIEKFFSDFIRKRYDQILKRTNIKESALKEAIDIILKLNPKPGNSMTEINKTEQYVIPDFTVTCIDGVLELSLNSSNAPELRVSKTYSEMLENYTKNKEGSQRKEAVSFVKQKIDSARSFIDSIKQRQETLFVTMSAIIEYQRKYFLTGDETTLRPMILKDISDTVGLDISTISRVANSKYVQTPYGTFLLKSFFSETTHNEQGEEISTREVKKILQEVVENEDKKRPVTDDKLMKILKEKGYTVARRTIAKYRETLGIPVARLRKQL